ncbi:MAG: hypothetical protein WC901_07320 [Candidatus Margulisiibacteriota bacterium]
MASRANRLFSATTFSHLDTMGQEFRTDDHVHFRPSIKVVVSGGGKPEGRNLGPQADEAVSFVAVVPVRHFAAEDLPDLLSAIFARGLQAAWEGSCPTDVRSVLLKAKGEDLSGTRLFRLLRELYADADLMRCFPAQDGLIEHCESLVTRAESWLLSRPFFRPTAERVLVHDFCAVDFDLDSAAGQLEFIDFSIDDKCLPPRTTNFWKLSIPFCREVMDEAGLAQYIKQVTHERIGLTPETFVALHRELIG